MHSANTVWATLNISPGKRDSGRQALASKLAIVQKWPALAISNKLSYVFGVEP